MKIEIQFAYSESVIPPLCRKERMVEFHDGSLEVHIPELSNSDAPVAIRSTGILSHTDQTRYSVEYRWYNSQLWTNVNLRACTPDGYTSREDDWYHRMPGDIVDITDTGRDYYLRLMTDTRDPKEKVAADLVRQLGKIVVIDGLPYRPAGEPRYVIATFGLGNNHGGTALFADDVYNPNIGHDRYFNLLDREKALARATEIAEARGDTRSLPMKVNNDNHFEILLPQAIKVDPANQHGDGDPFINQLEGIVNKNVRKPPIVTAASVMAVAFSRQ